MHILQASYVFMARTGVESRSNIKRSMRRVLTDDLNRCRWRTVTLSVRTKVMLKKLEISAKTEVQIYWRMHRRASSSAGAFCSGCGALMCNLQTSTLVKTFWPLLNSSIASVHLDQFCCQHSSSLYLPGVYAASHTVQHKCCCGYRKYKQWPEK
jgi:hypothetical protein